VVLPAGVGRFAAALDPASVLAGTARGYRDPRRLFLLAWMVFGMVFFTAATNKLPGYLLPLLPAAAALMGLALNEAETAPVGPLLACCAVLLVAFPIAARMLPPAVATGLSKTRFPRSSHLAAGRRSGRRGVAPGEPRAPAGRGAADRRRRHCRNRLPETRGGAGTGPHGFRASVLAPDFRPRG